MFRFGGARSFLSVTRRSLVGPNQQQGRIYPREHRTNFQFTGYKSPAAKASDPPSVAPVSNLRPPSPLPRLETRSHPDASLHRGPLWPDEDPQFSARWPNELKWKAAKFAPPTAANMIRRPDQPLHLDHISQATRPSSLDGHGNHYFDEFEMWESYRLGHLHEALDHDGYITTLSAFLHYVEPTARGAEWIQRIHQLLNDIIARGWRWGYWDYVLAIQAHARVGAPAAAIGWYEKMLAAGVEPHQTAFGAIMRAFVITTDEKYHSEEARKAAAKPWFDEMVSRGLVGKEVSFETVWQGLVQMGGGPLSGSAFPRVERSYI